MYVSGMVFESSETNALAAAETFAGNIHSNNNVDAKEMDNQLAQTGTELKKLVAMAKTTSENRQELRPWLTRRMQNPAQQVMTRRQHRSTLLFVA